MDVAGYYRRRVQKAIGFFKLHVVIDVDTRVIMLVMLNDRYYYDIEPLKSYFIPELARIVKFSDLR